jgi:hypothetical protein
VRAKIPRTKRGFALVLTLALLSFLLLLVVTLATSLRIETQSSFNNTQWNNARQNALMSMNIALGQLQELAGPDQRITATGGIVSGKYSLPQGNEYWTGAWNAANGNFEGWLVSDSIETDLESIISQAAPAPGTDGTSVWKVNHSVDSGSGDDDNKRVSIRKQPIKTTGIPGFSKTEQRTTGNFAYWVSDEGIKASALKTDTPIPGNLNILQETRIAQLANRKTELNELYNRVDMDDLETNQFLKQTLSFQQLEAIDGISSEGLAEKFHALTPASMGVLATTLDGSSGGLRQDLSQVDKVSNGSIPINDALIEFLEQRPNSADNLEFRGTIGGGGGPQLSIPVVTTEFALRIGFALAESGEGPLRIYLALRADMWNPFSLPIQNSPAGEPDLQITIEGLPTLSIRYGTADGGLFLARDSFSLDLGTAEYQEHFVDFFNQMAAGEVRNVYQSYINPDIKNIIDATPTIDGDDRLVIEAPSSVLNISVRTLTGELIQEFLQIPFQQLQTEAVSIPRIDYDPDDTDNLLDSQMPLRFWFRFHDEIEVVSANGLNDIERWSNDLDPRTPSFNFSDPNVTSFIEYDSDVYSGFSEDDFIDRPEFFYGGGRGRRSRNYHRFFDLPTVEPVSVATLRHLNLPSSGPNFLGNPGAVLENQVFDEWYFSTNPRNQSQSQNRLDDVEGFYKRPFTNPHISLLGEPSVNELSDPVEISKHTLLYGAFNINCTSHDTWKLMLSGNSLEDWDFRILYPGESKKTRAVLENPIYRLPFGADRHYKYPTDEHAGYPQSFDKQWFKTEWTPDWATSYTVGIREFTDEQIEELATAIVEVIKEQQTPSRSISDFLNKGILQQAIDRTDINTINGSEYRNTSRANRIPLNAPAFLNQADILNTIAPFIQARSDTFRIRAYGDAVNPVTGKVEGRAWCEAWVQRVPELVDESKDITASADGLGRQFKIVHFKWLDESQI